MPDTNAPPDNPRPQTATELLTAARNLIRDKGHCKGRMATDCDGNQVRVSSERACRFCMIGALANRSREGDSVMLMNDAVMVLCFVTGRTVSAANDDPRTTVADVMAWFDKAIEVSK